MHIMMVMECSGFMHKEEICALIIIITARNRLGIGAVAAMAAAGALVPWVQREIWDLPVPRVLRGLRESGERLAFQVLRDPPVLQESRVPPVPQE